jgi:NAD(P)-dependent dehydrogenase (short-subunit alcohol dehydrogenase family)
VAAPVATLISDFVAGDGEDSPVALVTGAAGAIGFAIMCRLLDNGIRVVAIDRDSDLCSALAKRITNANATRVRSSPPTSPTSMRRARLWR